ncbi:MAG TPA: hypothetical protein VFP84_07245 [Kofleriaceae bacterium]|nr:hypothetical protein [Kofleriaceae bacterium]
MNRVGLVMLVIVPVVIAGGILFRTAGHADPDPWAGSSSAPTTSRHRDHGRGVSVRFHDGKLELDGVQEMVQDQLEHVDEVVDSIEDLPPGTRARIKAHVHAARARIKAQLKQLRSIDVDQIGPAMSRLGDEVEREMEGLNAELSQFGEQYGKSFEQFGKDFAKNLNIPSPPIPPIPPIPGVATPAPPAPPAAPAPPAVPAIRNGDNSDEADEDADEQDRAAAIAEPAVDPATIADLKDVVLSPDQRTKLAQLRADADAAIANAKRDLDEMSTQLHDALGNPRANEADIAAQIDRISAKEAEIRKARILAWVRARSLLSKDQRKLIETAAKKSR